MNNKTILIAGASGLIGGSIAEYFKRSDILQPKRSDFELEDSEFIRKFESADILMNFSGSTLIRRWTKTAKIEMFRSRVDTNRKLGLIIKEGIKKPRVFLSASGIGIYTDEGLHDEESRKFSDGFIYNLISAWEQEALELMSESTSVAILRTGIVLSQNGGFLGKILPFYRMGLGAVIGTGKQAFSWIHMDDLMAAVEFILRKNLNGVFNLCSPGNVTNREFNRILSDILQKPVFLRLPYAAISIVFGNGATVIAGGQKVIPHRLEIEGFSFRHPDLYSALKDIVN